MTAIYLSWAFSCYGRKVEKAVQLRKDGSQVIIVHENDFGTRCIRE